MNPKQIFVLSSIFFLLMLGVFARAFHKPAELVKTEYDPLNFSFDLAQVARIQIARGSEKRVELMQTDGQWRIPDVWNARGDEAKIENFLKEIHHAKGELRASDPSLFEDFGIADSQALHISLFDYQGAEQAHLLLGTEKPDDGFSFVRVEGSNHVYLAQAELWGMLGIYGDPATKPSPQEIWIDHNLFHGKIEPIEKIEIHRLSGNKDILTTAIQRYSGSEDRTKKEWKYSRQGITHVLSQEKVDQFLVALSQLRAAKVLGPNAVSFEKPIWQMTLGFEDGRQIIFKAVAVNQDQGPGNYFFQVSAEPVIYELSGYDFEALDWEDAQFALADQPQGAQETKP